MIKLIISVFKIDTLTYKRNNMIYPIKFKNYNINFNHSEIELSFNVFATVYPKIISIKVVSFDHNA